MSTLPLTLLFSDGVAQTVNVEPGQTVVEAAAAAGLTLLTDCSNGQCGTCVAQCVSGDIDPGEYDPSVLPDDDRDDGAILCCVSKVRSTAVVELPYDSCEASAPQEQTQKGTVLAVTPIAAEIVRLDVQVEEAIHFLPGQYVRMRPDGTSEWRSYSMANTSGETRLVFYIRLVPDGRFSSWLMQAEPGDVLEIGSSRGTFFLRDESRPRLFVAGGTGLAPFLAMLQVLRKKPEPNPEPVTLLIGGRTADHLFAQEELALLQRDLPNLMISVATETAPPPGARQGYATDLIPGLSLDKSTRVYLCGPPPMVDAARSAAIKAGIRKSEILCERFA
ncbi:MAG: 2Fe-2S iron-sulfur cluster binding domain-containing protein [Alcaligenaceae bacterium]|nr:2Fe-2S iron-sulfur cluster binding domain-containing protein [Alcaligenaceae bacterium]